MAMHGRDLLGRMVWFSLCSILFAFAANPVLAARRESALTKPLTFNAFFNAVTFPAVRMAPNGESLVIETRRPDYAHNRFRTDLWLYRVESGQLLPLETSGYASEPRWSPDGNWIAFLSSQAHRGAQIYVISAQGGGQDLLTYAGAGGVHAYAWAPDSKTVYYAAEVPLTKPQKDTHKKEWQDVIR